MSIDDIISLLLGILLLPTFWCVTRPSHFFIYGLILSALAFFTLYITTSDLRLANGFFLFFSGFMFTTGLWFVRVILIRSISLNALLSIEASEKNIKCATADSIEKAMQLEIASRTDDLSRTKIATEKRGKYILTKKGQRVSYLIMWLKRVTNSL